jgi:hypothetical protein
MSVVQIVLDAWCEWRHPIPRRPVCGFSECRRCLRKRPVRCSEDDSATPKRGALYGRIKSVDKGHSE